jgi:two-component system, NtrC family, nitrogen regulation sensor histidine kinase NtrY
LVQVKVQINYPLRQTVRRMQTIFVLSKSLLGCDSCKMATVAFEAGTGKPRGISRRLSSALDWFGQTNLVWPIELASIAALLGMAILTTYILLSPNPEAEPLSPPATAALLIGNLVPAASLMMMYGRRLAISRAGRINPDSQGSLHVRLVVLFSLVAAVPAMLLAIFASILFQSGAQFWFSNSARGMLQNAGQLAEGYYAEKFRDVGDETVTMAGDLRYMLGQTRADNPAFLNAYYGQVLQRKLSESAIITIRNDGVQQTDAVVSPDDNKRKQWISPEDLKKLGKSQTMVVSAKPDRIEAIVPLFEKQRMYLYTSRAQTVPSFALGKKAEAVLSDYRAMLDRSRQLQMQFNALLYIVALVIMGIAVWVALLVADRLVKPVNNLVTAAQRIADGDLTARVEEAAIRKDEVGFLSRSFNRMTERLESQTENLLAANRQLGDRRALIEAVLESVSAAIVNVDEAGIVRLSNTTAETLLSPDKKSILGRKLTDLAPYLEEMIAGDKAQSVVQVGDGTEPRTLSVKIAQREAGSVVTFEDISQQLADQRRAAWSDVARRIAHEIKNPLTPIQLAAERLQRRFGNLQDENNGIFSQLTGTIIRQVGDLRKIVDEFSSFARMPKPVFRDEDMSDIVGHAVFLFEVAHTDIHFDFDNPAVPVPLLCDRRQVGQAVTNILKNAVETIGERMATAAEDYVGLIHVSIESDKLRTRVLFRDNGSGLPADRDRIIEPYVTTRKTGSGLGLAIVQKIMEEHRAEIRFDDNPKGGAIVTLIFEHDIGLGETTPPIERTD